MEDLLNKKILSYLSIFFCKLSDKHSKFELVIIGEGEEELKLKELSKKLNVEKKNTFFRLSKKYF